MLLINITIIMVVLLSIYSVLSDNKYVKFFFMSLGVLFLNIIIFLGLYFIIETNITNKDNIKKYITDMSGYHKMLNNVNREILKCKNLDKGKEKYNYIKCIDKNVYIPETSYNDLFEKNLSLFKFNNKKFKDRINKLLMYLTIDKNKKMQELKPFDKIHNQLKEKYGDDYSLNDK